MKLEKVKLDPVQYCLYSEYHITYVLVINILTHCKIGGFPNFNQFAALETYYCGIRQEAIVQRFYFILFFKHGGSPGIFQTMAHISTSLLQPKSAGLVHC